MHLAPGASVTEDALKGYVGDRLAGCKVIGFIGSFYAYEGLAVLIRALPAMVAQDPRVRLLWWTASALTLVVAIDIAKNFGKGAGFGLGLAIARRMADVMGGEKTGPPPAPPPVAKKAPVAKNKWVTASVVDDAAEVLRDIFDEAERRDPELEAGVEAALRAIELGRAARAAAKMKVRQPLTKAVIAYVESSEHYLVEALAHEIARIAVVEHGAERVRVRVEKPGALRFARSVGIEVDRRRSDFKAP